MNGNQKQWTIWGGIAIVVLAIAVVAFVALSSGGGSGTDDGSALVSGGQLIGDPDAAVTIVEFADFQCPVCANFALGPAQLIIREYVNNGRINILFRHYPFIGDESWRAAEASECAAEQGRFQAYEETVFVNWNGENQGAYSDENLRTFAQMIGMNVSDFDECMDSGRNLAKVEADLAAGGALGVRSTPTLFIDNEKIPGLRTFGEYRVKIEQALAKAGG